MKRDTTVMLFGTVMMMACASAPATQTATTIEPQPTATVTNTGVPIGPLDPVGTYEFTTTYEGMPVSGTLFITGEPGRYGGRIVTDIAPEIPLTAVAVKDNTLELKGSLPDGDIILQLLMEGMNFKGSYSIGPFSADVTGKKLPR